MTLPTDRDVFLAGLPKRAAATARLALARNTLDLQTFFVSEALLPEVERSSKLVQAGPLQPLTFSRDGDLIAPW
jgi:hypothetical protein